MVKVGVLDLAIESELNHDIRVAENLFLVFFRKLPAYEWQSWLAEVEGCNAEIGRGRRRSCSVESTWQYEKAVEVADSPWEVEEAERLLICRIDAF
jgi:hypothetical protein